MEGQEFIWTMAKLLLVSVLVMVNAFFVAAEFALVKVRETQLDPLVIKGNRQARLARRILGNLDAFIGATQLGITLMGLALGALVAPVFAAILNPLYGLVGLESVQVRHAITLMVGFVVNTFLLIVVGELAPKSLAIRKTLPTTLWVAEPMIWFYYISFPFIWLLNFSSQWILRRLGIEADPKGEISHSEEEVRLLVTSSFRPKSGGLPGRNIVLNALDLHRRVARDVMKPRQEMVCLDTQASLTECLDVAEKTRYSRFPLCEQGDLDQMLGVVHIKDLYAFRLKARQGADLLPVTRSVIYIPPTARLERLLGRLLERKLHLAVVVDEYGGTIGLVTLENILEELVGQIQDEFDQELPAMRQLNPDAWEITGALPLHQLAELVGTPIEEEGITTTSGFITHRLGGFPKEGDTLPLGNWQLHVREMDGRRVATLLLSRSKEAEKNES
ncbi:MAG TPA: hemolysin family protein [Candidatus Paceibacterota bacterium]|nr:hemolysin family protein [Verrucomicrobiota bacterium]HRY49936.1 hemolysin family protein [Candidatus Paceibacterota bacterium]